MNVDIQYTQRVCYSDVDKSLEVLTKNIFERTSRKKKAEDSELKRQQKKKNT
jgi:hypothetical protein